MSRTLLALAGAAVAIALPSSAHGQGQAQLASPPSGSAQTRTLICHGGPALQVRVHADPSPSWIGPASYPTKPVRMALRFAGGAPFTDAGSLPAGSCAWKDWNSGLGVPPGEVFVDVDHPSRPAPNPASMRADLGDPNRFYHFRVSLMSEPLAAWQGEWKPGAPSQAAGPATPATAAEPNPLLRQLMCRGGPSGFEFKVIADPSPAYSDPPKRVRLAIHYRVHAASDTAELALGSMSPGSCGWDMRFGSAKPPGEVIIDIETDAQASNATFGIPRDTSVRAGLVYQDTTTLKRYLSEPGHFWIFYHLDRGEPLALSHGAHKADLTNLFGGRVEDARATASGTGVRTGITQGSSGSVAGSLRDAAPASATLSSARVLADSASRTTVVRAPNTAGGAEGSLRGSGAGSTTTGAASVLRDTVTKRSSSSQVPAPTTGVAGALRDSDASATRDGAVSAGTTARPPVVTTPAPAPPPSDGGSLRGGTPASASSVRTGASVPAGPGAASRSRTLLPDVRIWGVATAPGSRGVRLVFNTDREPAGFGGRSGILVQFSQQRAPWDSAGRRWAYPPGWNSPWAAEITHPEHGGYMAEPMGSLELRQRYYYLITVESHDASLPPRQEVGSFIASNNPFANAPPAPGPEPASNDDVGNPLRGDATDAAGALRDQPAGATTAAGAMVRLPTAGASTGAGLSRTRLPPDVRIWSIETRPGNNGVKLWFETDRAWVPGSSRGVTVQFSTRQPQWEGGVLVSPAVASQWREVTSGRFEAEPHWTLDSGKRYYYLITVASNDASRRPRQATGSFLPAFGR